MENKNEQKIYILLLLVMCLISFGLGYYVFKTFQTKEIKPIPINDSITLNVSPLIFQDVTVQNTYVGYVEAINQVQIIPYINGYIQDVVVQAGQYVHKDDLLLTITPDEYKAKLDAAEAAVLQAQASFEYNRNYFDRVQKSGSRAFSEIEIDNAKNNFLQAEASLKNAKANKQLADINYHYTVIKSPINGLVGNFTLSSGDYVSPNGTSLFNIVQTNPIRVVFSLTDVEYLNMKETGKLFENCTIRLKLANGSIFEHDGEFKYTDNQINKNTNSLAIYTYFKNEKNELLPNSYVTVEISKPFKDSVLIDKNFVKLLANENIVTIVRNNTILQQKVDILATQNNQYVLKNTFQNGDLLVLDKVDQLNKNEKFNLNIVK